MLLRIYLIYLLITINNAAKLGFENGFSLSEPSTLKSEILNYKTEECGGISSEKQDSKKKKKQNKRDWTESNESISKTEEETNREHKNNRRPNQRNQNQELFEPNNSNRMLDRRSFYDYPYGYSQNYPQESRPNDYSPYSNIHQTRSPNSFSSRIDPTYNRGNTPYQDGSGNPYQTRDNIPYPNKNNNPYENERPYQNRGNNPRENRNINPYQNRGIDPYQSRGTNFYQDNDNDPSPSKSGRSFNRTNSSENRRESSRADRREHTTYSRRNEPRNNKHGAERRNNRKPPEDQSLEKECISQCVFNNMEIMEDDGIPSEAAMIKWTQDKIKNDKLKSSAIREIRKCFGTLSSSDGENSCNFSKSVSNCLKLGLDNDENSED